MKAEVLICIDWFLPGYKAGGPIKSVANIVNSLKATTNFSILCSNTDFGDFSPYEGIEPNCWLHQQGYRIMYLDKKHQHIATYRELLREKKYDIIYLNSLFSFKFTLLPFLAHKLYRNKADVILAPRGMLGAGALEFKKKKKSLFLYMAKAIGLFKNITWHASTELEASEIKAVFGEAAKIKVATNISTVASAVDKLREKTADNTTFFFLSRISPKKNLLGALKMLDSTELDNQVNFKIIGPIEDQSYWKQCLEQIALLPDNVKAEYVGAVPNVKVQALLKDCHFLLLPTLNENFGHVIIEAWEAGCPVILSDQTPWRDLAASQVGWDIALEDQEEFIRVIRYCILMNQAEYEIYCRKTQKFLKNRVTTEEILAQNKALFRI
ncbi:glycosyltransferase family 4 protein [Pontibacter vulgaris]|uniref:glycosyltransferase family 4 protein n=1 Tax=Pontibacter vulgaris TaxID=2905679 RepID=UPI001FA722DD|nr:glycosyltransferase [Pontibacter vulgaris]